MTSPLPFNGLRAGPVALPSRYSRTAGLELDKLSKKILLLRALAVTTDRCIHLRFIPFALKGVKKNAALAARTRFKRAASRHTSYCRPKCLRFLCSARRPHEKLPILCPWLKNPRAEL